MTSISQPVSDIDPRILGEAADWLVVLQSGEATGDDEEQLAQWRQISPTHDSAWQRAEKMLASFRQVPSKLGRDILERVSNPGRRQALRSLALLAFATPAAWFTWRYLPWREWSADLRTATGEQRTVDLADHTRLVLNTATAVDVIVTAAERRLRLLAGEILITTGKDPSPTLRPFIVQTDEGRLRALGTRFAVNLLEGNTRVVVSEGAVEIRPAGSAQPAVVRAGEQARFTARTIQPIETAEAGALLWARGMLLARDLHLDALAAELSRYHRGVLRCDPAIAHLTVSGAFPITDIEASLRLLEKTLPLRVRRTSRYWITLQPR